MVSQEKRTDLHNMYVLLKPIPEGLKSLIQAFLDHIKNEGIETISTLKGENVSCRERYSLRRFHLHSFRLLTATNNLTDSYSIRRKHASSASKV